MNRYKLTKQEKETFEHLSQAFAVYQFVDRRVVTLSLSDGFLKLFGYKSREEAYYDMDNDMYKDTHPDDVARIANAAFYFATQGGRYDVIYRTRRNDGRGYSLVHAMGEHVYTEDGTRLAHVWYMEEGAYVEDAGMNTSEIARVLSNVLHEQSIVKESRYDYLTGLPNMSSFFELAEARKESLIREGSHPMLLYMDFSGMKFFNTKHGFAEGDRILRFFARIIGSTFGSENCCRIGGDHFAAVSEESGLEEKLRGVFREFGDMPGIKTPPVHVGIYPDSIEDVPVSTACDRAKFACSLIKGSYSSNFNYYSEALREDAVLRQYIVENLDTAIREKWIEIYLQPIIRAVNEHVCDVEALARWIDPDRGVLSPASFIPVLEDAGLIYKLDLYVVDRVVELIKRQIADGFFVVPHSINLSRADFDSCDIVEEIRRRVDEAGISRDRITIEITESVIGRDPEFMKEQIERFRKLGFPVWMDDFGSGYSSLDVLQSFRFDLIKFDMSFMRKLDEGENGKIILTELMRMANSLGVDTVCEGVETEGQIRFLQEIGCSKLQGFYYSRPIPFGKIREMRKTETLISHENTEESEYYESIGRINLYDLGVITEGEMSAFHNVFDTLPIAVLEMQSGQARYMRFNRSYQAFIKRFYGINIEDTPVICMNMDVPDGSAFVSILKQCCESLSRAFYDEKMSDGSVVHSFIRRVSTNPVTGNTALAIVILSVTEPDESTTYADIARALATDYYNLFVIDLDTNDYVEYSSRIGGEELSVVRHGKEFFESAKAEAMTRIYEGDRGPFLAIFGKEKVLEDLDSQGVFTTTYRLMDTGAPMYVNMKITRMRGGNRAILGVSIIDAHMKQKELNDELQKERETLVRVMALSDGYLSVFTVDPKTGKYYEYSSSEAFDSLGAAKYGDDFFSQAGIDTLLYIYGPDQERFLREVTAENVMSEIRQCGSFRIDYHLMIKGEARPVTLKAALFSEHGEEKLVVGVRAWRERKER